MVFGCAEIAEAIRAVLSGTGRGLLNDLIRPDVLLVLKPPLTPRAPSRRTTAIRVVVWSSPCATTRSSVNEHDFLHGLYGQWPCVNASSKAVTCENAARGTPADRLNARPLGYMGGTVSRSTDCQVRVRRTLSCQAAVLSVLVTVSSAGSRIAA